MKILGFESSCDETAVAIYDSQLGQVEHELYSQVALHAQYGGVVPELASRDHIKKCLPLLRALLAKSRYQLDDIDGIGYTAGPGLLGAVLVGATFARSLALALSVPSIGIHHMEGHLLAPMLEPDKPSFPFVALLVSGGHSQLIRVDDIGKYQLIGDTLDDAAGEAFDKTAKCLGLAYPGGAALAKLAVSGDPTRFDFPRPMINRQGCDFSFSGLKTFSAQLIAKLGGADIDAQTRCDIAAGFETAMIDTLVIKCQRALQQTGLQTLVISGGVSANLRLREQMQQKLAEQGGKVYYPRLEFCTDNAAMIAFAGACRLARGERDGEEFTCRARWPL